MIFRALDLLLLQTSTVRVAGMKGEEINNQCCPLHECMRVGVCIHFCKTANKDLHANKLTHGEMCNNEYTGKHEVSELTTVSLLTQHTNVENTD